MIVDTPILPDYLLIAPYYLWGWRYMSGMVAWASARDGHRGRLSAGDKTGGLIFGLILAVLAGPAWAITKTVNTVNESAWFPNPFIKKPSFRERHNRRLEQKIKERDARINERDARIKELEEKAGIHD